MFQKILLPTYSFKLGFKKSTLSSRAQFKGESTAFKNDHRYDSNKLQRSKGYLTIS